MFNIFRNLGKQTKETSVEENLRFYMSVSEGIIALGLFSFIFQRKLEVSTYFGPSGVSAERFLDEGFWAVVPVFLSEKWAELVFSLFILLWFFLYRTAVKSEMTILVTLYSRINPPHDWERTLGQRFIPLVSVGLTFAFFGLALTVDHVELFCVIMLLLSVQDALGNNILRRNLLRHFLDKRYNPHPSDLHAPFIQRRREVALDYWVWRPQIERIGLMMIGTLIAFLTAASAKLYGIRVWPNTAQFIIMGIILTNEIVMGSWRVSRDRKLEQIEADQEDHERQMSATEEKSDTNI
ncbi:hypothetical protein U5922_002910 [Aquicoccus sp. G2-2]|uniref:hypothetical protein n=1 Tax=Aquicoccus sp. G2-2 TaxID=3092120 RepID=UPI002AE00ED2|nr:hypothetical protein [Aquicoccus sp. G2-2]MEA1112470.1 hypothetical protein [Aquicoccus sp. G2-2]